MKMFTEKIVESEFGGMVKVWVKNQGGVRTILFHTFVYDDAHGIGGISGSTWFSYLSWYNTNKQYNRIKYNLTAVENQIDKYAFLFLTSHLFDFYMYSSDIEQY